MITSEAGLAFIRGFEKCRLTAYRDGGGVWTIGWGATGPEVRHGLMWTQEQADKRFEDDIAYFEDGVNALVKVPITQEQFDALVSFAYNCGLDQDADTKAEGLGDSTLLRLLNLSDYNGAANEFHKWNKDNGVPVAGLTRRRAGEEIMFRNGVA